MKKVLNFLLIISISGFLSCDALFAPRHFLRLKSTDLDNIKNINFGSYFYPDLSYYETTDFYEFEQESYDLDYRVEDIFGNSAYKCEGYFSFTGIGTHYWEMEINGCNIEVKEIRKPL
ncbi:MAG: hypothetical protein JW833_06760 [Prolixibacteraceae bacterium]|nr:hypothetical protein [Prolixibacteraceae bacterium]